MADDYNPLLEIAQSLQKPGTRKKPRQSIRGTTIKADSDYVAPTVKEIQRELKALIDLKELDSRQHFQYPKGSGKKEWMAVLENVDPANKVAERATLRRLLRAKKIQVPDDTSTIKLVQKVMASGAFGRKNKDRTL